VAAQRLGLCRQSNQGARLETLGVGSDRRHVNVVKAFSKLQQFWRRDNHPSKGSLAWRRPRSVSPGPGSIWPCTMEA